MRFGFPCRVIKDKKLNLISFMIYVCDRREHSFGDGRSNSANPQSIFINLLPFHFAGQECGDSVQRPKLLLPLRKHGCNTRNRRTHGAELPPVRPCSSPNRARHNSQNSRLLLVSSKAGCMLEVNIKKVSRCVFFLRERVLLFEDHRSTSFFVWS